MTRAIRSILNIPVLWNAFLRTLNVVGSTYSFQVVVVVVFILLWTPWTTHLPSFLYL